MSWLNSDSFQNYDDVTLEYSADSTAVITDAAGRHDLAGIVTDGSTFFTDELISLNQEVQLSGVVHGIALKLDSLPASEVVLFQYRESDDTIQDTITITTAGFLKAYKGDIGGTLLATSIAAIVPSVYYYFESKVTIDNATGAIELRQHSATTTIPINFVGDTQNGGTGLISKIGYGKNGSSPTGSWCDKYTCDLTGSAFNDFLGNKSINAYLPNGAGFYTQWQPFPTIPNFGNVDDNPPDLNVTYNYAPSVDGDTDTFAMENTSSDTVDGVMVKLCVKQDAAEANGVAAVVRLGTTDDVTTPIIPSTDFFIYQFPFETDPLGAAWTAANFDASQAGYTVAASTTYWLLPYLPVYSGGTSIGVGVANQVNVLRLFIPYSMLVSHVTVNIGNTAGGKKWSAGLYSEDGNTLVVDSGPLSADNPGAVFSTTSPVVLEAGTYWYAWTSDSAAVTVSTAQINQQVADLREEGTQHFGHVANPSVAGQLPATMGAFTADTPTTDAIPLAGLH